MEMPVLTLGRYLLGSHFSVACLVYCILPRYCLSKSTTGVRLCKGECEMYREALQNFLIA